MRMNITQSGLEDLLASLTGVGHRYAYITRRTTPKLIKSHRETGESLDVALGCVSVVKEDEAVFSLNMNYQNKVNTNLAKAGFEENFESKPLPWGAYMGESKILIEHEGEKYARMYLNTDTEICKDCHEAIYFGVKADGTEIELSPTQVEILKGFLPPKKEKGPIQEGGSFDPAKPIVNTPKLSSITGIRINGNEYTVKR